LAATARNAGLESNVVAGLERGDGSADLSNDTGRLVAKNHRLGENEVANRAMLPVVNLDQTQTADTGVLDVDQDIVVVLELRDGTVFELDLVNALEDERKVLQKVSTAGGPAIRLGTTAPLVRNLLEEPLSIMLCQ
ncbi:hypothetical protein KEM55_008232, partial [Ascosphaera atra]